MGNKSITTTTTTIKVYNFLYFVLLRLFCILCHGLTDTPKFGASIPNVTIALGRDASLECIVQNLGTYKVAWIHIDRQMILTIDKHVISRVPRFSVTHDGQKTWMLNVANAQAEDRGHYMCQVNTNPMISQVGYLQVVVPPDILDEESTPSTVAVRENQNLTLTCKAGGFPEPKIMWKREDGGEIAMDRKKKHSVPVFSGRNLTIAKISRADMGAYLCIATNGVPPSVSKRITVDVEFPPMILVSNQLVGAPVGTDVIIDCQTEAYPRAISYWMFGDSMLLSASKHSTEMSEDSYRLHMKLIVKNLQFDDFGTYKCVSKNSLGETEGTIRLYEITMPSASPRERESAISSHVSTVDYEGKTESSAYQPTKPARSKADIKRLSDSASISESNRGFLSNVRITFSFLLFVLFANKICWFNR